MQHNRIWISTIILSLSLSAGCFNGVAEVAERERLRGLLLDFNYALKEKRDEFPDVPISELLKKVDGSFKDRFVPKSKNKFGVGDCILLSDVSRNFMVVFVVSKEEDDCFGVFVLDSTNDTIFKSLNSMELKKLVSLELLAIELWSLGMTDPLSSSK